MHTAHPDWKRISGWYLHGFVQKLFNCILGDWQVANASKSGIKAHVDRTEQYLFVAMVLTRSGQWKVAFWYPNGYLVRMETDCRWDNSSVLDLFALLSRWHLLVSGKLNHTGCMEMNERSETDSHLRGRTAVANKLDHPGQEHGNLASVCWKWCGTSVLMWRGV